MITQKEAVLLRQPLFLPSLRAMNLPFFREVQPLIGGVVRAGLLAGFYVAFLHKLVDEGQVRLFWGEHLFRCPFFSFDSGDERIFYIVFRRSLLDVR